MLISFIRISICIVYSTQQQTEGGTQRIIIKYSPFYLTTHKGIQGLLYISWFIFCKIDFPQGAFGLV